jgi:ceramide glucosyltransferase
MKTTALIVEIVAVFLALSGLAYGVIALWAARGFAHKTRSGASSSIGAGVSILKPLKGVDACMYAALASHCLQTYAGSWEIVFGVSSLEDEAVERVERLKAEHPDVAIRLVECGQRLGANGKVSTLVQLLPHAQYEYVVVNDSDIRVSTNYLSAVMAGFADDDRNSRSQSQSRSLQDEDRKSSGKGVGLVTVPYMGRAEGGVWSRMEALGIATDFMVGALTARRLEGGVRFGLGSTLATTRTALAAIGGFEGLVEELADDYELGARLSRAGYGVELVREVVETSVPAYTLRGFCEHQLRWARSTRDSRRLGYLGLGVTYVLPWALAVVVASGFSLWGLSLLSIALLVRVSVALTVGVGILRDGQVLRDLWLLPLRDCFGLFFWAWSYASDVVVWRGERFRLKRGKMERVEQGG